MERGDRFLFGVSLLVVVVLFVLIGVFSEIGMTGNVVDNSNVESLMSYGECKNNASCSGRGYFLLNAVDGDSGTMWYPADYSANLKITYSSLMSSGNYKLKYRVAGDGNHATCKAKFFVSSGSIYEEIFSVDADKLVNEEELYINKSFRYLKLEFGSLLDSCGWVGVYEVGLESVFDSVEPVCGNGVIDGDENEVCDDGNTISGDGCASDCEEIEEGWQCDDEPSLCLEDSVAVCGNGIAELGEECDDGNPVDGDGCDSSCQNECGNGIIEGDEECDYGDIETYGCSDKCFVEPGWECVDSGCSLIISLDGCPHPSSEGKISFGTRFMFEGEKVYCDISREYIDFKKEGDNCLNDYECKSNACLSEELGVEEGICTSIESNIKKKFEKEKKGTLDELFCLLEKIWCVVSLKTNCENACKKFIGDADLVVTGNLNPDVTGDYYLDEGGCDEYGDEQGEAYEVCYVHDYLGYAIYWNGEGPAYISSEDSNLWVDDDCDDLSECGWRDYIFGSGIPKLSLNEDEQGGFCNKDSDCDNGWSCNEEDKVCEDFQR